MSNEHSTPKFDTLAVRAGNIRSDHGEHSEALFLTSSHLRAVKRRLPPALAWRRFCLPCWAY